MELELRRLQELAARAAYTGAPAFTRFLEPPMESDARAAANLAGCRVEFFGGYAGAERCMAGFFAQDAPQGGKPFPICCLRVAWNARYAAPGHRDLLGALMGLGVKRETLGDIVLWAEGAALFVHEDIAAYVIGNLESAGRAKLRVSLWDGEISLPEPEGASIYRTAPSQRLDAVLASAYGLSRQEAQSLVRAGLVKVDHLQQTRPDAQLQEGALISTRGYGRLRLEQVVGVTRKGRLGLRLLVYGK